jgi:hypothetical protein
MGSDTWKPPAVLKEKYGWTTETQEATWRDTVQDERSP